MRWCTDCKVHMEDSLFYTSNTSSICIEHAKKRASKRYSLKREEIRKQQNEYNKIYARSNKAKYNAKIMFRKAKLLQATPKWADKNRIEEFYKLAHKLTASTGMPHQVDHIVPLMSKEVSGLHCENNLRVIPATENLRKSNRTWPDKANT